MIQETITKYLITMIIPIVLGMFYIGIKQTIKNSLKKLFEEENKKINTQLESLSGKIDDHMKTSHENDLALLWERLSDKVKIINKTGKCDDNTFFSFDNLFKRYDFLGGNHGMELEYIKVKKIYEKNKNLDIK